MTPQQEFIAAAEAVYGEVAALAIHLSMCTSCQNTSGKSLETIALSLLASDLLKAAHTPDGEAWRVHVPDDDDIRSHLVVLFRELELHTVAACIEQAPRAGEAAVVFDARLHRRKPIEA